MCKELCRIFNAKICYRFVKRCILRLHTIYYFLENTLKKSWKNIRDAFTKCMKKRELLTRSGAGLTNLPHCKYFKELAFLTDVVTNRVTESNLNLPQFQSVDNPEDEEIINQQEPTSNTPLAKRKRKLRESQDLDNCKSVGSPLDNAIASYLQKENSQNDGKGDADEMFCRSLIPILSSLPPKKNRKAKVEIQQLLFDIEFDKETDLNCSQ